MILFSQGSQIARSLVVVAGDYESLVRTRGCQERL